MNCCNVSVETDTAVLNSRHVQTYASQKSKGNQYAKCITNTEFAFKDASSMTTSENMCDVGIENEGCSVDSRYIQTYAKATLSGTKGATYSQKTAKKPKNVKAPQGPKSQRKMRSESERHEYIFVDRDPNWVTSSDRDEVCRYWTQRGHVIHCRDGVWEDKG